MSNESSDGEPNNNNNEEMMTTSTTTTKTTATKSNKTNESDAAMNVDASERSTTTRPESTFRKSNPSPTAAAQDTHPYTRGAVIEVWHFGEKSKDDWWSEPDSSDEDDGDADAATKRNRTVRLCDVIDRAPVENKPGVWKYYVHYRDFNRRMDEWITVDRIVSPPSVGNAKARALKKEEEQAKKKHARKEDRADLVDLTAPRSRRRASAVPFEAGEMVAATEAASTVVTGGGGGGGGDGGSGNGQVGGGAAGRRRRQIRRKSMDDDETIVAANLDPSGDDKETSKAVELRNKKEVFSLPSDAVTTHTVGEHVVSTVHAQELDEHEGLDEESLREHEEVTKVKNVNFLELGQYSMEVWYFSPLPASLLGPSGFVQVLYVCEFTFSMFARKSELRRFQSRLPIQKRHPPGNEIYRDGNLAMFEVDGLEEKIYCQNLCYIAKLFLDHKTLYFDVDPFLFYVLCEVDHRGFHPVGYFSKEKYSDVGYNLACILTFPAHQRKGYGRFLIAFSYELTKKEEKVGSPEKPMSDLGQQAYKPYWASTLIDYLLNQSDESSLSIMDISKKTSIMAEDIVFTLNLLGILKIINGVYFIAAEQSLLERLSLKYPVKEPRVDPTKLHWTPFLTDIKRDKFSIHSKKPSVEAEEFRGSGGF